MFKFPKPEDIDAALAQYAELPKQAQKDGKPYILECKAYKAHEDPRSQGFTFAARMKFASLEDMRYCRKRSGRRVIGVGCADRCRGCRFYDEECEGHKMLKSVVGPRQQGVMVVYMDDE